jgi:hypothetical protein
MGKRRNGESSPVSVRIDAGVAELLEREAEARMIGKGLLVQKALEAYLPTLPALPAPGPEDGGF